MELSNKQIIITILILGMILATINGALATNFTIQGDSSTNWKRVADDIVVMSNTTSELNYYDSNGFIKTITTTPYNAHTLVSQGLTPPTNTYVNGYDEEDLFYLASDKKIVIVDYSSGSITTVDQSSVLTFSTDNTYYILGLGANNLYFTYCADASCNEDVLGVSIASSNTLINVQSITATSSAGCHYDEVDYCGKVFMDSLGANLYENVFQSQAYDFGSDIINFQFKYVFNETNATNVWGSRVVQLWRPNKFDSSSVIGMGSCYDDANNLYCTGSGNEYTYDKSTLTRITGTDATINDFYIDYSMTDDNGLNELYIASNSSVYVYDGTNYDLLYAGQGNGILQFKSGIIIDDAVIYRLPSSNNWQFKTLDELLSVSEATPPPVTEENVTYVTINSTNNFTGSDFRTIRILENNQVVIGGSITGSEGIGIFDYSDTQNVSLISGVETDLVFSVDNKPSSVPIKLSVGTDEGVHSLEYNQTSQTFDYRTRDRWDDFFHRDYAYDVETSDYNNFVCDGDEDTLDYNVEFSDPTDLATTKCYDIEQHGNYVYVDAGSDGINVYDATTPTSVTLENNIAIRTTSIGLLYGDLMDIDGDLLLGIANDDEFIAYNITSDSSETEITVCDVAGAGDIISVELTGNNTAMAGMTNGKLAVCDLTSIEGENVVVYEPLTNEELVGIEYDGTYIHIIAGDEYIIANIESYTVNTTTNTPPTLDSYSVSDNTPEINQTVTVTMVAGNVETLDVIRYGMKCNDTVTNYTYNLLGQFECVYQSAGATTMTIAVTDNYHLGTWYNETNISITVLPTVFTGGLINVEVIDDETTAYIVGANITADGTSVTTDSFGHATITTTDEIAYLTTATANGYYDLSQTLLADGSYYVMRMNPIGSTNETNLVVTIEDSLGSPIESALVSYTNAITYNTAYSFTDLNGKVYFNNIDSGLTSIQASATNYESGQTTQTLSAYATTSVTITLDGTGTSFSGTATNRSCVDDGIWLCGSPSVVENSCTVDSDCLSDYCTKGINKCSRFNYSKCDEIGMPRTQKCIAKMTTDSVLGGITNWILTNLLWVIMIILMIVGSGMIFISWKGK